MAEPRNPDLPMMFVHFTGHVRGRNDPVPTGLPSTAEGRLVRILEEGRLLPATRFTYRPAVCVSESTRKAAKAFFSTGVNFRGPYAPWGLLLHREACIAAGFRPVIPASELEIAALQAQAKDDMRVERLLGRAIKYQPDVAGARADWLHEREWRRPFPQYVAPEKLKVGLDGLVHAVLTGKPPSSRAPSASIATSLPSVRLRVLPAAFDAARPRLRSWCLPDRR